MLLLASARLWEKGSDSADSTIKMVPVLVAVDHLDLNSALTAENVKIDHWPVNIVPEECASNLEEIENMAITARVAKGMPILQKDLIPKGKVTRLPIPDGFKSRCYQSECGRYH